MKVALPARTDGKGGTVEFGLIESVFELKCAVVTL